jgi:hypothetical protein
VIITSVRERFRSEIQWFSWAIKFEPSDGGQFESGTLNFGLIAGFCQALRDEQQYSDINEGLSALRVKLRMRFRDCPISHLAAGKTLGHQES